MPIVAILIGVMCLDLAFRGTEHAFAKQLAADFGGGEFVAWAAAILVLGGLGYVPALRRVSTLSLALVIVVLVLRNGGLFAQLAAVVRSPPTALAAIPLSSYGGSPSSGSGGGLLGGLGDFFGGGGGGGSDSLTQVADVATLIG